jgi:endonuclease G
MKKLFLFFVLIPTIVFSQKKLRDSVLVKSDIFTVMYSEILEQPLWVKYEVKCPNGTASRAGMDFYTNDTIHTSDGEDYANNIYDKGHMAPAADFNCDKNTLYKTFSYLNCVLQNQYLNRGVWRLLEVRERELAKKSKVDVTIRVVYGSEKLGTGATIPTGFYKQIISGDVNECYFFKNEKPTSSDYTKYRCNK